MSCSAEAIFKGSSRGGGFTLIITEVYVNSWFNQNVECICKEILFLYWEINIVESGLGQVKNTIYCINFHMCSSIGGAKETVDACSL